MTTYRLYLESGPKRKKTMVHVPQLLGCVAVGPTTEEAIEATPDAIRAFLRFMKRHGEAADPDASFAIEVAEHVTEGQFLGQGSPSITFAPDLEPVSDEEARLLLKRYAAMRETFASWAEKQDDAALDAEPAGKGRPARKLLLHVLPGPGAYLSAHLGGATGFHRLQTQVERGEVPFAEAFRRLAEMAAERVWAATPEQRAAVVQKPTSTRTLRKALRRTLEHDWEHLAELSRRPGGPDL